MPGIRPIRTSVAKGPPLANEKEGEKNKTSSGQITGNTS